MTEKKVDPCPLTFLFLSLSWFVSSQLSLSLCLSALGLLPGQPLWIFMAKLLPSDSAV